MRRTRAGSSHRRSRPYSQPRRHASQRHAAGRGNPALPARPRSGSGLGAASPTSAAAQQGCCRSWLAHRHPPGRRRAAARPQAVLPSSRAPTTHPSMSCCLRRSRAPCRHRSGFPTDSPACTKQDTSAGSIQGAAPPEHRRDVAQCLFKRSRVHLLLADAHGARTAATHA